MKSKNEGLGDTQMAYVLRPKLAAHPGGGNFPIRQELTVSSESQGQDDSRHDPVLLSVASVADEAHSWIRGVCMLAYVQWLLYDQRKAAGKVVRAQCTVCTDW